MPRKKRISSVPVFKEYTMGQLVLLPTDLEELIPDNHLVRVINRFIEQMDLGPLLARYKGGGTSSYHPKMMLKVLIYAYTQKIYSSRRIAKALRESIPFLWLSGLNQPDFRTINRFRGVLLKGIIEEVFVAVLKLLILEDYVKLEDYYVDGTKVEANANRYTAVWAKNTDRYEQQLEERIQKVLADIEQTNQAENERYGDRDLEEVGGQGGLNEQRLAERVAELNRQLQPAPAPSPTGANPAETPEPAQSEAPGPAEVSEPTQSEAPVPAEASEPTQPEASVPAETPEPGAEAAAAEKQATSPLVQRLEAKLAEVEQALAANPNRKDLRKAIRVLKHDYLPRAQKYAHQRQLLAGRNSYSKTDPDATFMRLKADQGPHGRPKPAYNIQIGTERQYVVWFSLHQEAGDSNCFIPHQQGLKQALGRLPSRVCGDAAYGNEENYAYLEQEQVGNYLKYAGFDREQKARYRPNPYAAENMPYDPELDQFTCPAGKLLTYRSSEHPKRASGYRASKRVYEAEGCADCALKARCTRAVGNRRISVSFKLWQYREQARQNLLSPEGVRLRKQRGVDVESVFGRLKEDWGFERFLLRGLEKVTVEWGILCLAHNLSKAWIAQNGGGLVSQ